MGGGQGTRQDPGEPRCSKGGQREAAAKEAEKEGSVGGREGTLLRLYFANEPWVWHGEQDVPVRVPLLKGCGRQATTAQSTMRGWSGEPGKDAQRHVGSVLRALGAGIYAGVSTSGPSANQRKAKDRPLRAMHAAGTHYCPASLGALVDVLRLAQEPGKETLPPSISHLPQPCSISALQGGNESHSWKWQSPGLKASACDPPPALFTGQDGASSAV